MMFAPVLPELFEAHIDHITLLITPIKFELLNLFDSNKDMIQIVYLASSLSLSASLSPDIGRVSHSIGSQ
jgi:hypothetical protein